MGHERCSPRQGAFWQFEYLDADGPAEIRKAVRQNIYYDAGVIKPVADNNAYHYSVEELKAAVDEAHHAGVPVSVHVYSGDAADNCIEAGVDSIEHGFSAGASGYRRHVRTTEAAALLRIGSVRGNVSDGLAADLIAMPSDPLDDIESLRKIDFVMKDGRVVRSRSSQPR